ncbi:MAG: hypothetical protein KAS96_08415, partial [Planctomycetes bacterium]|nr:hypothetical protein [Planctomycetota bacterium]
MFYKEINKRYREAMTAFLKKHFRYNTMNNWNRSTSYANNIKLHNVDKPGGVDNDTWWDMLWITEWQEKLSDLLEDFGREHEWQWQAGINGRSGGYVVLYGGGIKPSGYKSYCTHCGQKNYQDVPEGQTGICGRCDAKTRVNFKQTQMQVFTWPGKDVDMYENFEDWTLSEIRERVELVQEFDRLCNAIVVEYIDICTNYRITEEEILVPKTIKVLEP